MEARLPYQKLGQSPPIFGQFLLSPNGWMHQDATWYGGRPQLRRLCVRWGPSFPSHKGAQSPQFSANVRCGQTTAWTKMALGMEVGISPLDFVFDGDPATPRTEGTATSTQFLSHVYCDQTAGWMKTPHGTEVDLGSGHIVLDGVPALHETGTATPPPIFLARVYCGHGRPYQLLLGSCARWRQCSQCTETVS